jgi:hypothetical protein
VRRRLSDVAVVTPLLRTSVRSRGRCGAPPAPVLPPAVVTWFPSPWRPDGRGRGVMKWCGGRRGKEVVEVDGGCLIGAPSQRGGRLTSNYMCFPFTIQIKINSISFLL